MPLDTLKVLKGDLVLPGGWSVIIDPLPLWYQRGVNEYLDWGLDATVLWQVLPLGMNLVSCQAVCTCPFSGLLFLMIGPGAAVKR